MQHQHGPNCRHGHSSAGHGHSGGHQMPHGLGFPNQQQQTSPQQYFKSLKTKFKQNRIFFWHQVMLGVALDKFYEKVGAQFMRSLNCNMAIMIIGSIQMAISFSWIPKSLKHITSGLFFILLFLLLFNYNVVIGVGNQNDTLKTLIITTMAVYLIVGFRGSGQLLSQDIKKKSAQIYTVRPYVQNPAMNCSACKIIKFYRSTHCPACNSCVSKHSRHSIVFGICVGATNELFAILFFILLWITEMQIISLFFTKATYGIITQIMFYLLNVIICWMSFTQFMTLFILNIYYGITEQEMKTWPMQQYLIKIPMREFQNHITQGPLINFLSIVYSAFGLNGYENEDHALPSPLSFPPVDTTRKYIVNWAKARFYLVPQIPMHKNRAQIVEMMRKEQPKMIEMFKLQKQFREEIIKEAQNQNLNEFQIQQKVAMKMQAYIMKNNPEMMMQQPSPDQQRSIQLQMLTHMKKQFANETDLAKSISQLHHDLSQSKLTPIQANMRMRQLQQELMQRKMKQMLKQNQAQQNVGTKKEQQQQAPMVNVADEDL